MQSPSVVAGAGTFISARCTYTRGHCTYPTNPGCAFCHLHLCRNCGAEKSSKSPACARCCAALGPASISSTILSGSVVSGAPPVATAIRCQYHNKPCRHAVLDGQKFCALHLCQGCRGEKPSQFRVCLACEQRRSQTRCARSGCTEPSIPARPFCPSHSCLRCFGEKASQASVCSNCAGPDPQPPTPAAVLPPKCRSPDLGSPQQPQSVSGYDGVQPKSMMPPVAPSHPAQPPPCCRHSGSDGKSCPEYPFGDTTLCLLHLCENCGGDKQASLPRCTDCMSLCFICGVAEGNSVDHICGTCRALEAGQMADRNPYMMSTSEPLNSTKLNSPTQIRPNIGFPECWRWLFVWDFDQTITRAHATNDLPGQSPVTMLQNMVDPNFFRAVCAALRQKGHYVKIASWGDGPSAVQVIYEYLAAVFGPNSERKFMHNEGVEAFMPQMQNMQNEGKNMHIRNLVRQIQRKDGNVHIPRGHVVLFDDNSDNIAFARSAGHIGISCIGGFTLDSWCAFVNEVAAIDPASHKQFAEITNGLLQNPTMATLTKNMAGLNVGAPVGLPAGTFAPTVPHPIMQQHPFSSSVVSGTVVGGGVAFLPPVGFLPSSNQH